MTFQHFIAVVAVALGLGACGGGDAAGNGSLPSPAQAAMTTGSTNTTSLAWALSFPTPRIWHSLSSSASGEVLVAGEATGPIHVSSDAGATWTAGDSPSGMWISIAVSGTGDRIFAVQYGGGMFTSTDHGATWTPITSSPLVHSADGIAFEAVTVSRNGLHVAAVIQDGLIVLSSDAGATWHAGVLPDAPQQRWWRWIDSSADGRVLVAVSHNGEIYRSIDVGRHWTAVNVAVGGDPVLENWYRVAISQDGQAMAVAANTFGGAPGTGIYVSHDGGTSWTRGFSLVADYTCLAMSADGQTLGATVSDSNGTRGRVLLSTDGGASFAAVKTPGNSTDWRAITMSSTARRLAVAAGGFDTQTADLLYTARMDVSP